MLESRHLKLFGKYSSEEKKEESKRDASLVKPGEKNYPHLTPEPRSNVAKSSSASLTAELDAMVRFFFTEKNPSLFL